MVCYTYILFHKKEGPFMRLSVSKSKNSVSFYAIRSVTKNGKSSSEVVEKLGTEEQIKHKYHCEDAYAWAKQRVKELNQLEKDNVHKILIPFAKDHRIDPLKQFNYNVGYLFLQQIYHQLGLPAICKSLKKDHSFTYPLDSILSRLVYGRILYPSSKLSCLDQSKKLLEQPDFQLQHIYRALSVLAENSDEIQARLYKNSKKIIGRKTGVLFYDCTNFFFELEQEAGIKQYGVSKEHRPNPIVQMGLFLDRSGIPLAFCINKGNQNEQLSLKPLEQTILRDFELSRFVICTDAGLSSEANRKFNNYGQRSFITTQSIKKLKADQKQWALDPTGWSLEGRKETYDISKLEDTPENRSKIFYKQQLIEGWDEERGISFDQNLIVTYSLKYKLYQENIRSRQVERAQKMLSSPSNMERYSSSDAKRFIKKTKITSDGEIAEKQVCQLDTKAIAAEAVYDGFYAVSTNLDDDPAEIVNINHDRWEIEESFRIMKSEFRSRPVFLQRDDRIEAHFLTCFIALLIYRILEKKLGGKYTCEEIIKTLREMDMTMVGTEGYIPSYTRTELTDALHEAAGFHTDYEVITKKSMAGICRRSKGL